MNGLSQRYVVKPEDRLRVEKGSEILHAQSRDSNEEAAIFLKDGIVTSVVQYLYPGYGGDAVALTKRLFDQLYFWTEPVAPRDGADDLLNRRQGVSAIVLEKLQVLKEDQRIILDNGQERLTIQIISPDNHPQEVRLAKSW